MPPETFAKQTAPKLAAFRTAAGSILFYQDTGVVSGLQQRMPLYADTFPVSADKESAMMQYAFGPPSPPPKSARASSITTRLLTKPSPERGRFPPTGGCAAKWCSAASPHPPPNANTPPPNRACGFAGCEISLN